MGKREAIAEYQRLVRLQHASPESEQWKYGPSVKLAQAKAYVEIEYARLGIRN